MTSSVLSVTGLTKRFGKVQALAGVDLEVQPGATGLLGPNGAGKSTLIQLILGLIPADGGSGQALGHDIRRDRLGIRLKVGYLPEDDCYFDELTGMEMVAYAAELCGLSRRDALARTHDVLGYVGLEEARHRPVSDFSTGMRQRIKLAQALVHDPQLLLLDEPASGLDPPGRRKMLELIDDLATNHGKSILLSTHLLPDVEHVCSNVILLAGGKVVTAGAIKELLTDDRTEYLIRVNEDPQKLVAVLQARHDGVSADADGTIRAGLSPGGGPELFFQAAAAAGVQIRHLSRARRGLEDLFFEQVEGQR